MPLTQQPLCVPHHFFDEGSGSIDFIGGNELKRVPGDELLDTDAGSPSEVASALRSLRWVNRLFGGSGMHTRLLRRVWPRGKRFHVLEVAAGQAEALRSACRRMRVKDGQWRITLLDRSAQHLPTLSAWSGTLPAPELLIGDALSLPLPDDSVDVVSCCLFLHHLNEQEARTFFGEALRVARLAVVVNDLERRPLHYVLARLFSLVDPSRLSRHDGPVSVRQAYTREEIRAFLTSAGYRFEIVRGYLFRLGVIVWKSDPASPKTGS